MRQPLNTLAPRDFAQLHFDLARRGEPMCGTCNYPLGDYLVLYHEKLQEKISEFRLTAQAVSPRIAGAKAAEFPIACCPHCEQPLSPGWLATNLGSAQ